ncbi:casein kinase substrate phosphoprotein PP28-domain-containing protein [Bisporella sp. PMI_857]|nr:casein kinase substrate phosphoprotein PP28-domain-containing protein [Bisporella sp. PMI_857]
MAPGGPPGGGRGRGGKFKKFTRGGGKHFSKNLRPLDADGNEINEKDPNASTEEEEESSEEESSEEEVVDKPVLSREERRAAAKAKKEAAIAKKQGKVPQAGDLPSSSEEETDDDMPVNPNHSKAARNQATLAPVPVDDVAAGVKDLSVGGKGKKPVAELSRREREAIQAQQAKERYQKLHEAGKTDEAKADLARLKLIREKREAEAARKQVCRKGRARRSGEREEGTNRGAREEAKRGGARHIIEGQERQEVNFGLYQQFTRRLLKAFWDGILRKITVGITGGYGHTFH